jgi:hypothetical protein
MAKTVAPRKQTLRRDWTNADVKLLRQHSRDRTPVETIAKALKRTPGALRQKALHRRLKKGKGDNITFSTERGADYAGFGQNHFARTGPLRSTFSPRSGNSDLARSPDFDAFSSRAHLLAHLLERVGPTRDVAHLDPGSSIIALVCQFSW